MKAIDRAIFGVSNLRERTRARAVNLVLRFYEAWIIPPQRVSLIELKRREFRDRKLLLNPYKKEEVIVRAKDPQKMQALEKSTTMRSIKRFRLTYNRHEGMYPRPTNNFPESYNP